MPNDRFVRHAITISLSTGKRHRVQVEWRPEDTHIEPVRVHRVAQQRDVHAEELQGPK